MEIQKIRRNYLTKKDIKIVGGLVAPDEEFRCVEGESALWISNYGRLLSKRKKNPRILKTVFQNGYHRISLPQRMYGKSIAPTYYIHVLVAKAFCPVAEWIRQSDAIEVHHINKVNRNRDILENDYANNLMWIPRKIHRAVDQIESIELCINGKWEVKDFVTAAEHMQMCPYGFIEMLQKNEPSKVVSQYIYYDMIINDEGKPKSIDCRIRKWNMHIKSVENKTYK